jgi:hypothetical protein
MIKVGNAILLPSAVMTCPALLLTAALAVGSIASAAPVEITSYDIEQTNRSGWGGWCHDYNGTIVNTGRTVSGNAGGCNTTDGNQIANYSGGSGTLNDGVISTSISSTHLFTTRNADDGQAISPVITLHLGGTFVINSILLSGGDIGGNIIPGALNGVTVEIGGIAVTLATGPVGTPNAIGVPVNDLVDLTNTALAGVPTDRIVLKNFTASFFESPFDQFSISEIEVDGVAEVPPTEVDIDVKPSNTRNRICLGPHGKVRVAVLSSPTFDARKVLPSSLTFGKTGNEASLIRCKAPTHVNRDRRADLLCVFSIPATGLALGDTEAVLKGTIGTGPTATHIIGYDVVNVLASGSRDKCEEEHDDDD